MFEKDNKQTGDAIGQLLAPAAACRLANDAIVVKDWADPLGRLNNLCGAEDPVFRCSSPCRA